MIRETATVTRLEGSQAVIDIQRQSVCDHCELNNGCGTGAIGRLLGHRSKSFKITNEKDLKPGDQVILGIQEKAYLNASLVIYGLPLMGLISGGLLSQWVFGESDVKAFVGAAVGMTLCLIASNLIGKYRFSRQFNPAILQIIAEPKD
ncbi:MAG: SoxR reducing system RseC family protein [Proteobacteria bacterium]|nr:SoxR reducing system RseC family protein [Pseudomonadota bacterium]